MKGDTIAFFKHIEIAAKWKGQAVLQHQELMDLNCRKGTLSCVTVKRGGTDCLGRLQSLHNFPREQFRLLSLGRETGTVSPILRPEERPHSVLKSQPAKGFRQLIRAVMVSSHHCRAFIHHPHFCLLLQSLTNPKKWFFIFLSFLRE